MRLGKWRARSRKCSAIKMVRSVQRRGRRLKPNSAMCCGTWRRWQPNWAYRWMRSPNTISPSCMIDWRGARSREKGIIARTIYDLRVAIYELRFSIITQLYDRADFTTRPACLADFTSQADDIQ